MNTTEYMCTMHVKLNSISFYFLFFIEYVQKRLYYVWNKQKASYSMYILDPHHFSSRLRPVCLCICLNVKIFAIIRAIDSTFGMKVVVNCTQIEFISNSGCHALPPTIHKHANSLFFNTICRGRIKDIIKDTIN